MASTPPRPPRNTGPLATQVVDVAPTARRTRAILTVTSGTDAGRVLSLPVGELLTLGRSPDCTYAFDDGSLSREHARLVSMANGWIIKDSASTNGTFVNGTRSTSAVTLVDGDRIQLGSSTTLRYAIVDEAEEHALRKVFESASRDALTGVHNRKHLEERLEAELQHAARHGTPLSVIIIDIDHFKRVNDTHGHLAGDTVLREVARRLGAGLRPDDVLARYGGEEFVVIARSTDLDGARVLAERLRTQLAATPVDHEGTGIAITASMGVASLGCCGDDPNRERLLGTADGRLYQAKESGRNRVVG